MESGGMLLKWHIARFFLTDVACVHLLSVKGAAAAIF
jgi:hypothetical protein